MNKKIFAILSLILSIISLVPMFISPDTANSAMIYIAVFILIAIVGIVFGIIGMKASKGMGITGIVIGAISLIALSLSILGLVAFKSFTNCVDQGNGMAKCEFMGGRS